MQEHYVNMYAMHGLASLVPANVAVAESDRDLDAVLTAEEEESVARALSKRRREFVTGRRCAQLALGRLGVAPCGVPKGEAGEPVWPPGVVGSITHCRGYRACAVARADEFVSLGIDAEVHEPLPQGVLGQVATLRERSWARRTDGPVFVDRLLFSAKESVYKVWFPLARRALGFEEIELTIDLENATFRAELLVAWPVVDGRRLTALHGRWRVERDLLLTAVLLRRAVTETDQRHVER